MANRIMDQDLKYNPNMQRLTELQKGQIALKYVQMNGKPQNYDYYKRFLDNKGDVKLPGFDSVTGKPVNRKKSPSPLHRLSIRQSRIFRKMTLMKDNKKFKAKIDLASIERRKEKRQMMKDINRKLLHHKDVIHERNKSTILSFNDTFQNMVTEQRNSFDGGTAARFGESISG